MPTNYEKIKAMSVEEMAREIKCPYNVPELVQTKCSRRVVLLTCSDCKKEFLLQEAEE